MLIFGILRFPSGVAALSARGRSRRLGHPRFACVKVMYFRRFARHSSDGEWASSENVSTALGAGPRILESRTGRRPSQIGLRVDHKAQTTLHTCILDSSLRRTNDLRGKRSQVHDSGNGSGAFFGHTTHHREKSKKRQ